MKRTSSPSVPAKKQRGVVLIIVAGVLAVLAALGASFFTLMGAQTRSAVRYSDSVRAEMLANAGIHYAVANLRRQAYLKTEDPSDPWYGVDYLNGATKSVSYPETAADPFSKAMGSTLAPSSDRFTLRVSDAASKININSGDNLGVLLDNLCRLIGPPLVPADLPAIQPRRWGNEMFGGDPAQGAYLTPQNANDLPANLDLYYQLVDESNNPSPTGRPLRKADGTAVYGDGYALAAYRAAHGRFKTLEDVKRALTYVERSVPPNGVPDEPLERMEVEAKYQLLLNHITLDSWVDPATTCVGKFEWVTTVGYTGSTAIDRDKSWVPPTDQERTQFRSSPNTFKNESGSLLGSMVSIMNGHGSGQLRMIVDNGTDWIKVEPAFTVDPGPTSSYMIVAREAAPFADANNNPISSLPTPIQPSDRFFPQTDASGNLVANPNIDYTVRPLCIHRSPVNINTATDKVLAALFMGINVQHGHPLSVGTDADRLATGTLWRVADPHKLESYLLTPKGLKRTPVSSGAVVLDRPAPWNSPTDDVKFGYLNIFGSLGTPQFLVTGGFTCNEAHELAYRVIMARTRTKASGTADPDPTTADAGDGPAPYNAAFPGYERGPFKSWDDLFFRVIKPWDDVRSSYYITGKNTIPNSGTPGITAGLDKSSVARIIMANLNPKTDILKFNPNIEYIDRWGRNFTEMEPVMAYTNEAPPHTNPAVANPLAAGSIPIFAKDTTNNSRGTISLRSAYVAEGSADAGSYVIRSFRYRSDEMLDKTDLNRSTTECAFDSRGIFEIQSIGTLQLTGKIAAERKVSALVKVYDVWRESTQRQFVQGTIRAGSKGMGDPGTYYSGQIARDSVNTNRRLPLVTLPEPLVPLPYRLVKTVGIPNVEKVDPGGVIRDQYGVPAPDPTMPDAVLNHILPANYDGQIVLATNTLGFDPNTAGDADTFLASFNGTLDTETCLGNGREQAKVPHTVANDGYKYRVVDTCSLLGVLNDTMIDQDTDLPAANPRVYKWAVLSDALKALNPSNYWENVSLRMGDLHTDGVFLSSPGVCGNDATLKYMYGDGKTPCQDSLTPGNAKLNFNPGSDQGNIISMWMKPAWHHNDHRTHPLFDATNPGSANETSCRAFYLKKHGNTVWAAADIDAYVSANRRRCDDLYFTMEGNDGVSQDDGARDKDFLSQLHGGYNWVDPQLLYSTTGAPQNGRFVESPSYRVQPFRWHYIGMRWNFNVNPGCGNGGGGHWRSGNDGQESHNVAFIGKMGRPFINTQSYPERPDGGSGTNFFNSYWSSLPDAGNGFTMPTDLGDTGLVNSKNGGGTGYGVTGQPIKWKWADPAGVEDPLAKSFGFNNLNEDYYSWIYRHLPCDGSYAVIDELKISSKDRLLKTSPDWPNDRAVKEQRLSRYYIPPNPADPAECPTFTSQTMWQSLKGFSTSITPSEFITLARVGWTVFTPRFLHEYKLPTFPRNEHISRNASVGGQAVENILFPGPFDYDKYNEAYTELVPVSAPQPQIYPYGVDRPTPRDYVGGQAQASKGVEIELLNYNNVIVGSSETAAGSGTYIDNGGTFGNPDLVNRYILASGDPVPDARVRVDQLQYRVRFRYPADTLVDNMGGYITDGAGKRWVNPQTQFLLDTPVFDDISVTYIIKPRILDYKEVME